MACVTAVSPTAPARSTAAAVRQVAAQPAAAPPLQLHAVRSPTVPLMDIIGAIRDAGVVRRLALHPLHSYPIPVASAWLICRFCVAWRAVLAGLWLLCFRPWLGRARDCK